MDDIDAIIENERSRSGLREIARQAKIALLNDPCRRPGQRL
jgi:hypothetical protein